MLWDRLKDPLGKYFHHVSKLFGISDMAGVEVPATVTIPAGSTDATVSPITTIPVGVGIVGALRAGSIYVRICRPGRDHLTLERRCRDEHESRLSHIASMRVS